MKKIICLLTMIFMMTSVSLADFTDVPKEHWAYQPILKMQRAGILSGYNDGSFLPSNSISLGEFAAVFTKIFGIQPDYESNYFTDIPKTHWAKGYIESVREYVNPYYDSVGEAIGMDKYSYMPSVTPEMKMSREAFIYALYRVFGYDENVYVEGEEKIFEDYEKMLFPKVDMIATKAGLVGGELYNGKKYMRPERYLTRAEVSNVFAGLLKYESTKVENEYQDIELEQAFTSFIVELNECNIDGLTKQIYDTAGILENENFKVENEELIKFVKNYMKKFSYEINETGFYSFNRGYVTISFKAESVDIKDIINFIAEHFEDEDFETQLVIYLEEQQKNNEKVEQEETICFAKQNGEWKIILK